MRVTLVAALVVVLAAGVSAASPGAHGRWVIRDLGTLGGKQSEARAVNEGGQIAGYAETRSGKEHAVVWESGRTMDLGTLGGPRSVACGINGRGEVVGWADTKRTNEWGHVSRAFLWSKAKMRKLGTLGGLESGAAAINERGAIVGWADTQPEPVEFTPGTSPDFQHPFVWQGSAMRDLGRFVGYWNSADALNENGAIVVNSQLDGPQDVDPFHAFLLEAGRRINLGGLPKAWTTHGVAVNEGGQVVGTSGVIVNELGGEYDVTVAQAFLWERGTMRRLTSPGVKRSSATDINDLGQVVGSVNGRAALWRGGRATQLPALAEGKKSEATAITESGDQIVGWSEVKSGRRRAVLWTYKL